MEAQPIATSIRASNLAGKLGLGLYIVPGYPDWKSSLFAVKKCTELSINFVEFPILGSSAQYSQRTGTTLSRALDHVASSQAKNLWEIARFLDHAERLVGIVYGCVWDDPQVWNAPTEYLNKSEALLLEGVLNAAPGRRVFLQYWSCALVKAVSATQSLDAPTDLADVSLAEEFIYLSLGRATGRRDASEEDVFRMVQTINDVNPSTPICAAFGLSKPAHVQQLKKTGIDGVIIGSAAIQKLEEGRRSFAEWLESIVDVL
jgi:tryptophan synthase alpha chain